MSTIAECSAHAAAWRMISYRVCSLLRILSKPGGVRRLERPVRTGPAWGASASTCGTHAWSHPARCRSPARHGGAIQSYGSTACGNAPLAVQAARCAYGAPRPPGAPGRLPHHGLQRALPQPCGPGGERGGTGSNALPRLRCARLRHPPHARHPTAIPAAESGRGSSGAAHARLERSGLAGPPPGRRAARAITAPPLLPSDPASGTGGAPHPAAPREPRRTAWVTPAVVAFPVTTRAHGHQAPLVPRPVTPRCRGREHTPQGGAHSGPSRCPREPPDEMLATTSVRTIEFTRQPNFFLMRPDGTTAAEQFFGQKPHSILAVILNSVDLPPAPRSPQRRF